MRMIILIMTAVAIRHHLLSERRMREMTADTRLLFMGLPLLLEHCRRLLMTGDTDVSNLTRFVPDHVRQMWGMTAQTVNLGLLRNMRFMAILTLLAGSMRPGMARATIELGMLIRILL